MDQPETVTTQTVHMRIRHRNRRGRCHHRFNRGTTVLQDLHTGFGSLKMRGGKSELLRLILLHLIFPHR